MHGPGEKIGLWGTYHVICILCKVYDAQMGPSSDVATKCRNLSNALLSIQWTNLFYFTLLLMLFSLCLNMCFDSSHHKWSTRRWGENAATVYFEIRSQKRIRRHPGQLVTTFIWVVRTQIAWAACERLPTEFTFHQTEMICTWSQETYVEMRVKIRWKQNYWKLTTCDRTAQNMSSSKQLLWLWRC